jgi:hypothetical protein
LEERTEPAGVIIMAVAEYKVIGCGRIDPEKAGILHQDGPLTGIEKDAFVPGFEPE